MLFGVIVMKIGRYLALAGLVALMLPVFWGAHAFAQSDNTTANGGDRYELKPFEDGFIRMSRETGAISFCTLVTGSLVCRLGADEREAFEETLGSLEDRLDFAEERLDSVEAELHEIKSGKSNESKRQDRLSGRENGKKKPEDDGILNEQAEEELDKALDFAQQAMRRFVESVKELRKDLEEKYNEK